MSRSLLKKVTALEDELWAKAKHFEVPGVSEFLDVLDAVSPLDIPIYNVWINDDAAALERDGRAGKLEAAQPPIHPAFLPDEPRAYRRQQWALHHSQEYRELSQAQMAAFAAHVRATYDLSGGALAIALCAFSADLDKLTAVQAYVGFPLTREEMADSLVRLWARLEREREDHPDEGHDELWLRATLAVGQEVYGRTMTGDEVKAEWEMWRQVTADMEAGRPAGEVAAQLRAICEQYPRRVTVGSFKGL